MTSLIVGGIVMLTILVLALIAYRVTRRPEHVPPRRREFNELRERYRSAQSTLNEIKKLLDLYRPTLDDVGVALSVDVRTAITKHDDKILENDR